MKLFIKIFLWFLVAITLTNVVIVFVTRTFQTEPIINRFQRSTRNQMVVYGGTATQIVNSEGEEGLRQFLIRLRDLEPPREVDLVAEDGKVWFGADEDIGDSKDLVVKTLGSGAPETDYSVEEKTIAGAPVVFPDGRKYALVLQWERTAPPSLFFGSWLGYLRLAGLLLTAVLLCYLLAMYLTRPIRKLRLATQRLAAGDLQTRVRPRLGRRRDELADLAADFDDMAERIESLITSQQRLSRDISHELRSPLARMNVALGIAKQKAAPEVASQLERIESEADRLNQMIGRILTLSKLETGALDYEKQKVDLVDIVASVADDADFEARPLGKSVKMTGDGSCTVDGNEPLLRSAVENVLRNAVRYTREGTAVEVSVVPNGERVKVLVQDHGGGVPEDELRNLFKPFYRVGEARERSTGGIGLGLAIADRAIAAHDGTIAARNKGDGLEIEITLRRTTNGAY
jgi:two-component system sensor histidine kinase CpxA